jgi:hypothetical protein
VPDERPDLSLFLDILRTLEAAGVPYMIIGAFAATVYGSTRVTYDIDIVVDLAEGHIEALAAAYPPPRDALWVSPGVSTPGAANGRGAGSRAF